VLQISWYFYPALSTDRATCAQLDILEIFEKDGSYLPLKGKLTKVVSRIGAVKRIKPFVSTATQRYINYCSVVWGNCGKTLSDQ